MKKVVIGIDLGTVNSCVATFDGANVQITQIDQSRITPSYIYYDPNKPKIYYGNVALSKVNKNVIYDAKRFIGRRFQDDIVKKMYANYRFNITAGSDNDIYFEVPHNNESIKIKPEEISAELLKHIKEEVCLKYDVEDVEAVITVPAHFNNNQRDKTKLAATKAGIKVLKLMNEPTAAALSYFHGGYKKNLTAMVFDLGGGTFDISLIDINDKDITVKATDGDTFLGGRNFDENIMHYLSTNLEDQGETVGDLEKERLKQIAKKLKENLSFYDKANEIIMDFFQDEDREFTLDRKTFNKINQDDFDKCLKIFENCLDNIGMRREDIDQVIMVGGSSRIPKLQEMVAGYFGQEKIMCDLDPDETVAAGAAIQAFIMSNKESQNSDVVSAKILEHLTIIDINPLTLGADSVYDKMINIIPKNSSLPVSKTVTYCTAYNMQSGFTFSIYEGERAFTKLNNLLGKLSIGNIPQKSAGEVDADVTFTIDHDGILNVKAKCEGQQENLTITLNQYDINDAEVTSKISDVHNNKDYDEAFNKFVQAKINLMDILNEYSYSGDIFQLLKETKLEEKDNITKKIDVHNPSSLLGELKRSWDNYLNSQ